MPFEDITIEQLRAATKAQIITVIDNRLQNMTKKQLIILVLRVTGQNIENWTEEIQIQAQDGPSGQTIRQYQTKDALGNIISKRNINWTYYESGPINEIFIDHLDSADILTLRQKIKHFLDGRQPKLSTEP